MALGLIPRRPAAADAVTPLHVHQRVARALAAANDVAAGLAAVLPDLAQALGSVGACAWTWQSGGWHKVAEWAESAQTAADVARALAEPPAPDAFDHVGLDEQPWAMDVRGAGSPAHWRSFAGAGAMTAFGVLVKVAARPVAVIEAFAAGHPSDDNGFFMLDAIAAGVSQLHQRESMAMALAQQSRSRKRLELLSEAGRVLASSLDYEFVLKSVIELCMPTLADFGFFDLVEPSGEVRRLARAHQAPALEAALSQTRWQRSERTDINLCALSTGFSGVHNDIGEPWMRNIATSPEHFEILKQLAFRSMITVPVAVQGRLLGALTMFYSTSGRQHEAEDVALAEEIGRRAATAIEHVRLYQSVRKGEAEARDADRRKDEFIAMLGHELRNPLMPVQLALDVLEQAQATPEQVRKYHAMMSRQTKALARIVDDLLEVSRVMRGKIELRLQPVSLQSVVASALDALRKPLSAHSVHVHAEAAAVEVMGDQVRLEQVVVNLLNNAAKYTPAGGRIDIFVEGTADEAHVRIKDTGTGISAAVLPHIFELFAQDDRDLARAQGGLGIGLSIVRALTQLHGGEVHAASGGRGQGSEFALKFPRLSAQVRAAPQPEDGESLAAALPKGLRVLVVDDNPDILSTLRDLLSGWGQVVRAAHDGLTAVHEARTFRPSLVLMDIGLPGIDGYEAARQIRADLGAGPLLIALSGYGQASDRQLALEAGFDDHVAKPASAEAIAARLREADRRKS